MTSLFYLKLAAIFCILITSLIAGLAPIRIWFSTPNHKGFAVLEALAGGIFLGAAFFHMLPDANRQFTEILGPIHYPYANLICALGFTVLLFLEKVIMHYAKHGKPSNMQIIPYILAIVLSVHALSEGTALGVNMTVANVLIIFIAIMVHKSSESLALASSLAKSNIPLTRIVMIFIFFSLVTPLGILLGSLTTSQLTYGQGNLLEAIFNAFAAGTFLYIATLHNLHHKHIHEDSNYFYEFIALAFGLTIMAIVAIWV